MNEKPIPDYLYHYTNLQSLCLILKNKTLKFNSLVNMDDLEEVKANDLIEYGKYCYVSSWTDCEKEKLSLWNMYTKNMEGVRIKLRKLPFETYTYEIKKGYVNVTSKDNFFPKIFFENEKFVPIYYPNEKFIERVEYTDEEKLICPNLLEYDIKKDETTLQLNLIGKYKREEWSFQDEVRYMITFLPVKLDDCHNLDIIKQNILKQIDIQSDNCFLKIKDEYFNDFEITTGPKMSTGDEEILKLMIEKYCPTAKIIESKFKGKIRI